MRFNNFPDSSRTERPRVSLRLLNIFIYFSFYSCFVYIVFSSLFSSCPLFSYLFVFLSILKLFPYINLFSRKPVKCY